MPNRQWETKDQQGVTGARAAAQGAGRLTRPKRQSGKVSGWLPQQGDLADHGGAERAAEAKLGLSVAAFNWPAQCFKVGAPIITFRDALPSGIVA
jgi:hypothetical protein